MLKALVAASLVTLMAAPAFAAEPCCVDADRRVTKWVAPLDNAPYTSVRLLGIAETPANEGVLDRALRLVAGAGLVTLAATDPWRNGMPMQAGAGAVGAVMLWTSLTGSCPAYLPLGLSTRDAE